MGVRDRLKQKLGIASPDAGRHPIRVFLLEDDERRCEWFAKRFKGDQLDMAGDVAQAKELLESRNYDTIFLDHDLPKVVARDGIEPPTPAYFPPGFNEVEAMIWKHPNPLHAVGLAGEANARKVIDTHHQLG